MKRQLWCLTLSLNLLTCACHGSGVRPMSAALSADFFPLREASRWEYLVSHFPGRGHFRFVAVVRGDRYLAAAGKRCRVVDETYTGFGAAFAHPVAYCRQRGFLDRIMSIEYRGSEIYDNGLRSIEHRFLPLSLAPGSSWEGLTNAYELADGSAYVVRQVHRAVLEPEAVEVPAGRFWHCLRVETQALHNAKREGQILDPTVVFYYVDWYAAGVGLIKTRQTGQREGREPISQMELLSYSISGAGGPRR